VKSPSHETINTESDILAVLSVLSDSVLLCYIYVDQVDFSDKYNLFINRGHITQTINMNMTTFII
jgi:hypothetical protein